MIVNLDNASADLLLTQELAAFLGRSSYRERTLRRSLQKIAVLSRDFDVQLYGRIKSIVSTSQKMLRNRLGAHQVLDIIGIRVVTKHTHDCYRLIRRIHCEFPVLLSEYDDYIAAPKPNGYRSLHTTVATPCGLAVEIQIRTHAMHKHAEHGTASHGHYKRRQPYRWPAADGAPATHSARRVRFLWNHGPTPCDGATVAAYSSRSIQTSRIELETLVAVNDIDEHHTHPASLNASEETEVLICDVGEPGSTGSIDEKKNV